MMAKGRPRRFQTPEKYQKRSDHVWVRNGNGWKCCLCGAVVKGGDPPDYPTPEDWKPHRYEPLLAAERDLAPYAESKGGR